MITKIVPLRNQKSANIFLSSPQIITTKIFITTIMLCCIKAANGDGNNTKPPDIKTETGDEIIFAPKKTSNKVHVFHSGEMRGVWVPYFNLSNGKLLR